jgi:hypothetical protein
MDVAQLDTPAGCTTLTAEDDYIDVLDGEGPGVTTVRAPRDALAAERLVGR